VTGATPELLAGAQKVAVYLGRTAPYRVMDELLDEINVWAGIVRALVNGRV
jgi:hypothetical protein